MKNIYLSIFILFWAASTSAQYNLSTTYVGHNDLNAARYEPSELELGEKTVQVAFNSYLWAGNTALDFGLVREIFLSGGNVNSEVDKIVDAFGSSDLIGAGLDIQLAAIAFQLKTKSDKRFDFSFSVVDKAAINFKFSKELMQFVWKGNKQFVGQTVDFGETSLDMSYNREYAFGAAFPLFGANGKEDSEGFGMRLGFRAKYIQGIASIQMEKSGLTLNVPDDGRQWNINWDYKVNTAGINNAQDFSPLNKTGKGFGIDLGLAMFFGSKIEVNASLLDVGKVTYDNTENIRTFSKTSSEVYNGAIISNIFGGGDVSNEADYIYKPNETAAAFDQKLGTKFIVQAEFKTPKTGKNGKEYTSNAIFVTYVQGLVNAPGTTTRPLVSVAYNHDIHKIFDIGVMAAYGGYNQLLLGAFFDINIDNFFKVGIGTDNLTPLFVAKSGTGVDISMSMSFSF